MLLLACTKEDLIRKKKWVIRDHGLCGVSQQREVQQQTSKHRPRARTPRSKLLLLPEKCALLSIPVHYPGFEFSRIVEKKEAVISRHFITRP